MKLFLYLAAFIVLAQVVGVLHAVGDDIPLRLTLEGAVILLLAPLLVLAWWLSRAKVTQDEHKPVEKPE